MPNVFHEQAEDRFTRSLAFLNKAESLLQDDLVNRSALADAVSAIKNMLQGYLLLRVSRTPETAGTQRWQEIAASNSMPELLQACGEAGLDLRGLAVEIKSLNRERNRRMHDDPGQRIETQQARNALDLARKVQSRIRTAVQGKATGEPEPSAPARLAAVARAAVTGQLGRSLASHAASAPIATPRDESISLAPSVVHAGSPSGIASAEMTTTPAARLDTAAVTAESASSDAPAASQDAPHLQAGVAPESGPDTAQEPDEMAIPDETERADNMGDSGESGDTQLLAALASSAPERKRRRAGLVLARALLVAAVLILGVVAGAGLMLPIATGHAPGWLAFATRYLPATPTAPVAPMATATATPAGPFAAGSLVVTPSCAGGAGSVTLINTSEQPVRWTMGSPDGSEVLFALAGAGTTAPSQSGILKGGASVMVTISGTESGQSTLVVITSAGTVQLPAPTC